MEVGKHDGPGNAGFQGGHGGGEGLRLGPETATLKVQE